MTPACSDRGDLYGPEGDCTPEAATAAAKEARAAYKPKLGEPMAYLLHEGMGNYRVELAREFDVEAHRRLDPIPLFRCPGYPHDKGLVYDANTDEGVCRLCGYRTVIEMGWA